MNEPRPAVARFVGAVLRAELERGGEGLVAQRIMMRFHDGLWKLIGSAGFDVLVARSLVLAQKDDSSLGGTSAGHGGLLPGLEDTARDADALQRGGVAIVTHFVELLVTLIGEDLAMRLVRDVWPGLEEEER